MCNFLVICYLKRAERRYNLLNIFDIFEELLQTIDSYQVMKCALKHVSPRFPLGLFIGRPGPHIAFYFFD